MNTPVPDDFYKYVAEDNSPIEDQYRLYNLRKAAGVQIQQVKETENRMNMEDAYNDILELLDYWLDIPEDTKKFIAIWTIGTYFHEEFNTYPYLFFNAMRGSGKTRLLRLLSWIGNKGDGSVQNDMKEAVLFRMQRNKILCVDEFENVGSKDKQTLRQIFNSAYKKGLKITR